MAHAAEILSEAGQLACRSYLAELDTNGPPMSGEAKAHCQMQEGTQDVWDDVGKVSVDRYVHQGSRDWACLVPPEERSGIVGGSPSRRSAAPGLLQCLFRFFVVHAQGT